jgi:hypothetical protein
MILHVHLYKVSASNKLYRQYKVFQKMSRKLLGTRFEARNCISEPGPYEPYMEYFETPCIMFWALQSMTLADYNMVNHLTIQHEN